MINNFKEIYFTIFLFAVLLISAGKGFAQTNPETTEAKMQLLESIVTEFRVGLQSKENTIAALKEENTRLNTELSIITQANDQLTESLAELTGVLKAQKQVSAGSSSDEITRLKAQLRGALNELKKTEKTLQNANIKRAALSHELLEAQKKSSLRQDEIESIKQKLHQQQAKPDDTQKESSVTTDQRLIQLQEENIFLNKRLNRAHSKMRAMENELIAVKNAYVERENIIPDTIATTSRKYKKQIQGLEDTIQELQDEINRKNDVIKHVNEKHKLATDYLTKAEAQRAVYEKRAQELEEQLTLQNEEINTLAQLSEDYKKQIDQLTKKSASLEKKMAKADKTFMDKNRKLSIQLKEAQALLKSRNQEAKAVLEGKNKQIEDALKVEKALESQLSILAEEVALLKKNQEELRQKNEGALSKKDEKYNQDIKALKNELTKRDEQLSALSAQMKEANTSKDKWKADLAALQSSKETLNTQLVESQKKLSETEQTLKKTDTSVKKAVKTKEEQIRSLEEKNTELVKNFQLQKDIKAQYQVEMKTIQTKLDQSESLFEEMIAKESNKIEQAQKKIEEKDKIMIGLQKTIEEYQQQTATLNEENESLKMLLASMKKDIELAKNESSRANTEEMRRLISKAEYFEEEVQTLQATLQVKEQEVKRIQGENDLLLQELIDSKDMRIALNKEILQLNEKLKLFKNGTSSASVKDTAATAKNIEALTKELLSSENEIYEKELIIESLRQEQNKLTRALVVAEENNELLKRELESLKAEEYSFREKNNVMDIELNQIEKNLKERLDVTQ